MGKSRSFAALRMTLVMEQLSAGCSFLFQQLVDVAHLFALDLQVAFEGFFRLYGGGDALDYADAG